MTYFPQIFKFTIYNASITEKFFFFRTTTLCGFTTSPPDHVRLNCPSPPLSYFYSKVTRCKIQW